MQFTPAGITGRTDDIGPLAKRNINGDRAFRKKMQHVNNCYIVAIERVQIFVSKYCVTNGQFRKCIRYSLLPFHIDLTVFIFLSECLFCIFSNMVTVN